MEGGHEPWGLKRGSSARTPLRLTFGVPPINTPWRSLSPPHQLEHGAPKQVELNGHLGGHGGVAEGGHLVRRKDAQRVAPVGAVEEGRADQSEDTMCLHYSVCLCVGGGL